MQNNWLDASTTFNEQTITKKYNDSRSEQERSLNIFLGGVSDVCPAKIVCDHFLVTVVDKIVLSPVSCLAQLHCTAAFLPCKMANFQGWEGVTQPHTPIIFAPAHEHRYFN